VTLEDSDSCRQVIDHGDQSLLRLLTLQRQRKHRISSLSTSSCAISCSYRLRELGPARYAEIEEARGQAHEPSDKITALTSRSISISNGRGASRSGLCWNPPRFVCSSHCCYMPHTTNVILKSRLPLVSHISRPCPCCGV